MEELKLTEALIPMVMLGAAVHQFWTGHKKDLAGNIKAGRLHMILSVVIILVGYVTLGLLI